MNHFILIIIHLIPRFYLTQAWARREALARETVIANGGEIQFGVYYNNKQFEEAGDCGDTMPTIKEAE